jgi:long-chain acyl-CoA synthetase
MTEASELYEAIMDAMATGQSTVIGARTQLSSHDLQNVVSDRGKGIKALTGRRHLVIDSDPMATLIEVLACWRFGVHPVVVRSGTPHRVMSGVARALGANAGGRGQPTPDRGEAVVILTSGTTGHPKPVALPVSSVLLNAKAIAKRLHITGEDNLLCALPLGHLYGLSAISMTALLAGSNLTLRSPSTPPPVLEATIRRQGVTAVQGPPAFFRLLANYRSGSLLKGVTRVTVGGELVERRLRTRIFEMFPNAEVDLIYGLSEAGPRVSHVSARDPRADAGFVGTPFAHWQVGTRPGDRGRRIALKGEALMLGYVAEDGYSGVDSNGWFVTNDLGEVRRDGLYLLGRADRVFKRGGSQVNPDHVERVALEMDQVVDVRCFPEPHPLLGMIPVLEVKTVLGASLDALREHLAERLEKPSVPVRIRHVDHLLARKASFSGSGTGEPE